MTSPGQSGRGRRRSVWGRLLVSTLLTIAGLELLVRLAGLAPPVPKDLTRGDYVPDSHLPYRPAPNARFELAGRTGEFAYPVKHNELGWRDYHHETNKPAGVYRILGLGDSFTYGSGASFEQTYLHILEQLLNERRDAPKVEVLKAGVGGYFPEAERLLLQHEGLLFRPDLVLVTFNHTDLVESLLGIEELRVQDGYLKSAAARRLGRAGTFLFLHSHLARVVLSRVQKLRLKTAAGDLEEREDDAWKLVEHEYDLMRQLCTHNGARMAIVYIPLVLPTPEDELNRLASIGKRLGIPVINTGPALETAAREKPVFWPRDGHCTPHGYRAIASSVSRAIDLAQPR